MNDTQRPRYIRLLRFSAAGLALLLVASAPWTLPSALSRLDYFRVRRIEFEGVQYARTSELVDLAAVDTSHSVWLPLDRVRDAVRAHAMVASVEVRRKLPGTLLITVVERVPIALVPRRGILAPTDVEGTELPIDASLTPVDAPVLLASDTAILQVLDVVKSSAPDLFARIISVRRSGPDDLRFDLGGLVVRARDNVTVERFRDILPVQADLERDGLQAVELDLRFKNQVIARLP